MTHRHSDHHHGGMVRVVRRTPPTLDSSSSSGGGETNSGASGGGSGGSNSGGHSGSTTSGGGSGSHSNGEASGGNSRSNADNTSGGGAGNSRSGGGSNDSGSGSSSGGSGGSEGSSGGGSSSGSSSGSGSSNSGLEYASSSSGGGSSGGGSGSSGSIGSGSSTSSSSAATTSKCPKGDTSPMCEKPTGGQTTPIVLGVFIPLIIALIVLFFIHRRSKKRQAIEEANDPHKSLDFGVEVAQSTGGRKQKSGKNAPEMVAVPGASTPGMDGRRGRGLSMDMTMQSPYLLPAALQGSRESLHSMSRAIGGVHDPYRPVNMMRSSQETTRSPRLPHEGASARSVSTFQTGDQTTLIGHASAMSQSPPPPVGKRGPSNTASEARSSPFATPPVTRSTTNSSAGSPPPRFKTPDDSLPNIREDGVTGNYDPTVPPMPLMDSHPPAAEDQPLPPRKSSVAQRPPRKSSMSATLADRHMSDASCYPDDVPPPPLPPKFPGEPPVPSIPSVVEPEDAPYDIDPSLIHTGRFSIDNSAPSQTMPPDDRRVSTFGMRPLPPDNPEENAEQRANRIRSFYKEYFDDSRPHPAEGGYYEDNDFYMDGAIYDPATGEYIVPSAPYAQPMGRRAMTPPPRSGPMQRPGDHARHYSTMSGGRLPHRGRGPPAPVKKALPPPKALTSLPTPHMLREDTALIMNPVDFAPPTSFREHQNGRRPDSPLGVQRPYSPSVRPFSPLVPARDELSVIPSPHALRKSGTFTSLDFAPPRFRFQGSGSDAGSDAGSIRSARSGISAVQMDAVRAGAYRVSRIPKEMVTTKDDLAAQLRPKMDLVSKA